MNRPEYETQEEWRNGVPQGPLWRDIDWIAIAFAVAGVITGYILRGLV